MKLFASKFYQTLIFNVATIAAIVVGIVQFAVRAYKENNGPEKTRKMMQTVLQFVDTINAQLLTQIDTDVPVVKVAQGGLPNPPIRSKITSYSKKPNEHHFDRQLQRSSETGNC